MAADLPPAPLPMKAPPPAVVPPSPWTWWIEGGAQAVIGDPYVPGLSPAFDARPKGWGWDIAGGFDYRFNGVWHAAADFRYGENRANLNSRQFACLITNGSACGTLMNGANSATRKEHNWAADFMVGRDVGIGLGNSQVMGGLRVAQIQGTTTGNVNWVITSAAVTNGPSSYSQSNKFTGVGPRVALQGNYALGGAWSIDYMVGAAGLYAWRSTTQSAFTPLASGGFPCFTGCPINASTSSNGFVFNPDAMVGLSYAFSPAVKLALNYHVDAYFNAFRAFGAGGVPPPTSIGLGTVTSPGNPTYVDRIYHGPSIRLTVQD
jgi:Legionella pneumophila major outer membrane protein precursor